MFAPILVVDDNDDAQEFLSSTLTDAGFGVLQARDGREALALLVDKAAAPRLVIVDLIMPVMDGAELVEVLHCYKRLSRIPVLMVSSADLPEALRPAGARYLKKPFDESALLSEVNGLLGLGE